MTLRSLGLRSCHDDGVDGRVMLSGSQMPDSFNQAPLPILLAFRSRGHSVLGWCVFFGRSGGRVTDVDDQCIMKVDPVHTSKLPSRYAHVATRIIQVLCSLEGLDRT